MASLQQGLVLTESTPVDGSTAAIQRCFEQSASLGLSKQAQIHRSIVDAIEMGDLASGAKLPAERDLSELLQVSLGTTQKALSKLAQEGFIVRQHGLGTFVAKPRNRLTEPWHYRFSDPVTGESLPIYTKLVNRTLTKAAGPWSKVLGEAEDGYVCVVRRLDIDNRFSCYSEMYLLASRFGRLMKIPTRRFENINLKALLAEEFAAPTIEASGQARVVQLPASVCKQIKARSGVWGLQIEIVGRTMGRRPITFQTMMVPPTDCPLHLDFVSPAR